MLTRASRIVSVLAAAASLGIMTFVGVGEKQSIDRKHFTSG